MEIRRAQEADLLPLAELFDKYRIFYENPSDVTKAQLFLQERIRKNESELFVAETSSGLLTGFVQLYPLFSSTRMSRLWLLNDLYVIEGFRGQGIAKKMLHAAKQLCRETNACGFLLETAKGNSPANYLYQKEGLILDTHHNYYSWDNE